MPQPANAEEVEPPLDKFAEWLIKGSSRHGRETDTMHEDVSELIDRPDDDADAVDDDTPPYRQPMKVDRGRKPYKAGHRQVEDAPAKATGAPPWWASTDPETWESNQRRMRENPKRNRVPGEDNIIGMSGAF